VNGSGFHKWCAATVVMGGTSLCQHLSRDVPMFRCRVAPVSFTIVKATASRVPGICASCVCRASEVPVTCTLYAGSFGENALLSGEAGSSASVCVGDTYTVVSATGDSRPTLVQVRINTLTRIWWYYHPLVLLVLLR
jgi:hypothetical protein